MSDEVLYQLAADGLLLFHVLVVAFIVLGLLLVFVGGFRHWSWVRNIWFRVLHLAGVGFVVAQSWLGEICPLTVWEMGFRIKAGDATYSGSFIAHWLEFLLYYQAPGWVFVLVYSLFGLMVLLSWYLVTPTCTKTGNSTRGTG